MTQRIWNTQLDGRTAEVLMGWDRPFQRHFLVIELEASEDDTPFYSNLNDPDAGDLEYFVAKAKQLGLDIPSSMVDRLKADAAVDLGNDQSFFDDAGQESRRALECTRT